MYKTAVYTLVNSASEMTYIVSSGALNSTHSLTTLVNGVITHQKQQISKRWYCSVVHWHLGNFMSVFVFLELEGLWLGLELGLG